MGAGAKDSPEICFGLNHRGGQGGRTVTQPAVSFLQGDDIGTYCVQHIDNAPRFATTVKTDAFVDVIAGKPKRFCPTHDLYMGAVMPELKVARHRDIIAP